VFRAEQESDKQVFPSSSSQTGQSHLAPCTIRFRTRRLANHYSYSYSLFSHRSSRKARCAVAGPFKAPSEPAYPSAHTRPKPLHFPLFSIYNTFDLVARRSASSECAE
jgi:hypothetical protein